MIEITQETFDALASKIQDELADIIQNNKTLNEYELIVYKYVFISELKIPLLEDFDFKVTEDSFIVHLIPDGLQLELLRRLDDAFDKFEITFMPNKFNVIKLKFRLRD